MARLPGAIWKPVSWANRSTQARSQDPNIVVFHVAVSEASSLYGFFEGSIRTGAVCSHFYVRRDGNIEQYIDTKYRSAAEREGSPRAISVETQGGINNPDTERWTPEQVAALAYIAKWSNEVHKIPLGLTADSQRSTAGISWHRRGIKGNFGVEGNKYAYVRGETWSGFGKLCPGLGKIHQIDDIVKAAGGSTPVPTPTPPKVDTFTGDASKFVGTTITTNGGWWNYKTAANAKNGSSMVLVMPAGKYKVTQVADGQPHLVNENGKYSGWVHNSVLIGHTPNPAKPSPAPAPKYKQIKLTQGWYNYKSAAEAKAGKNYQKIMPAGTYNITRTSGGVPHLVNVNGQHSGWVHPSVLGNAPQPAPKPTKKSLKTIAKEIVHGVNGKNPWGNNPYRTQKLRNAGYSPAEILQIQREINKLL